MKEALNKFDQGGEGSEVDLGEVYDHLAYAEFQVCFHQRSGSSFSSQTSAGCLHLHTGRGWPVLSTLWAAGSGLGD